MNRDKNLLEVTTNPSFDVVVIGGGASGIGAAVEACLRGYRTLLLERSDFTKGTSSRSTKLVHGGVRYMAQGDLSMVIEALRERGYLLKNAPHICHNQSFIIPNYKWWEGAFYTIGLTFYDLLAGRLSLGRSRHLSKRRVLELMPGIDPYRLKGGVLYHDGQFDDSRLAMELLHLLDGHGGIALNYCGVESLIKDEKGYITGVTARDSISGAVYSISGKAVINATGVWVDEVMEMDQPGHEKSIRPSQGVHLVLSKEFLPGGYALMIPKTSDGRVLFAVPWHDHLVVGTTDTPLNVTLEEPVALEEEIEFILRTASQYLKREVRREDVLSVFAGLRPLAAPKKGDSKTKEISRNHKILMSDSRLITIIGGKWTTYRKMAEDLIEKAIGEGLLKQRESVTRHFKLAGESDKPQGGYGAYGDRAAEINALEFGDPGLARQLHPDLPYTLTEVKWIAKHEMVYHLEDMMARRLRALFLNARASLEIAEEVAEMMAEALQWNRQRVKEELSAFKKTAEKYIL